MIKFIAVIVMMLLAEGTCAIYIKKIAQNKAISAGLWSSANILFGKLVVVYIVDNNQMIVAAMIGAFLGTWLSIKLSK